jgi:hypothetical protein
MTERAYEFSTPVWGFVACTITAKNATEAKQRFEDGDFGDVYHMEFAPVATPAQRKKLVKLLEAP